MLARAVRARLAVLQAPAFRRLLAGRAVSQFGDGLYAVAAMWLAYSLTDSSAVAGVAGFLVGIPGVCRVLVGPVVDDRPLGRVLVASELAQAAFVLVVPLWFWLVGESVAVVLATMFLAALAGQFAAPAQSATVPRVVDDDDLVRANSLSSVVGQATDAGSRLVAGALVAATSAVALYVANVVTFLVAAIGFLGLTIPGDDEDDDGAVDAADGDRRAEATGRDGRVGEYVADVRAGVDVVAGSALAPLLGASLFANFLFGTAAAVLPAYADGLSDATAYGTLLAVLSAGRVLGSVAAPAFEDRSFASSSVLGFAAAGVAWVGGVAASGLLATAALFGASRIPVGVYNVNVKAVLQTGVPNDHLGRATATIGTASAVVAPFGMLAGGALGDAVSPTFVLYASGVGFALTAAYWLASPTLRRFGAPTSVEDGAFALAE
ncbi:MFS transporter [Halorubellus salinus]|uniref:MFS transporter n=1 Tax=Halorubellus salinus TaxID=755309 RepID=UPI001D05C55B|nr:MFS transporter [Halorubellus salinus]